jgi:hypothetical protein
MANNGQDASLTAGISAATNTKMPRSRDAMRERGGPRRLDGSRGGDGADAAGCRMVGLVSTTASRKALKHRVCRERARGEVEEGGLRGETGIANDARKTRGG